jgi:hypothetical protein
MPYNRNSISFWGPLGWDWLHNLAKCYPIAPSESDIHYTYLKIKQFIEKLPCLTCKIHSINYIKKNPILLHSNKDFQFWAWKFHNSVNDKIGKKNFTLLEYDIKYRTNLY